MVRRILAFLLAIATMVLVGSTAHSLFVQRAWSNAASDAATAATIPLTDRVDWIVHDLVGMGPTYGLLVTIALLLGLLIAGMVASMTGARLTVFALAGASCIFAMFTILKLTLGTVGVFGARGPAGLGAQMFAGVLAALLFALLTRPRAY